MFTSSSVSMFGKIYFFHCFILAERKFIRIVMIAICCVHLVKTEVKSSDHSPCFLPLCCLDLFFSFAFPVFSYFLCFLHYVLCGSEDGSLLPALCPFCCSCTRSYQTLGLATLFDIHSTPSHRASTKHLNDSHYDQPTITPTIAPNDRLRHCLHSC